VFPTCAFARKAFFDCHSNETLWHSHSNITPISWLVQQDVDEGRRKMNLSDQGHILRSVDEIASEIQEGGMPFAQYKLMYPVAKLIAAKKQALVQSLGQ
jgi:hypothetical protein